MTAENHETEPSDEKIITEIPILARLAIGSERLRLFLTTRRLIFAHVGKRGTGALATSSFFGMLAGALEDLFKSARESKRGVKALTPQQILDADKDNFYLDHDDIVSVEVEESSGIVRVQVLSKDVKLQLLARTSFDSVVGLFRTALGDKVTSRRL